MALEVPPSSKSESPSAQPENKAKALAQLKVLCETNNLYWPVSQLENHPAHGSNNEIDLL